jgi:hypothetical protein
MIYSADQVWGLAVRADTINSGYCKEAVWDRLDNGEYGVVKTANKGLVKQWLIENQQPNDIELARGREIRHFFNGFLLKEISGKINDFERQALRMAQIDEFNGRNLFEFSVISCLPSVMVREESRKDLAQALRNSTQLTGSVGDAIQGEIEVVRATYKAQYDRWVIVGRLVDSYVSFYYNNSMEQGSKVYIKGKIKSIQEDNMTRLHYVKKA